MEYKIIIALHGNQIDSIDWLTCTMAARDKNIAIIPLLNLEYAMMPADITDRRSHSAIQKLVK